MESVLHEIDSLELTLTIFAAFVDFNNFRGHP